MHTENTISAHGAAEGALRLLLVEDDSLLADGVQRVLASQGHMVDVLARGERVAPALKRENFDQIILDIGLPDVDGFEVLRRIREQGESIPVLILTARDAVNDRVKGLDVGADDYMVKPFALEELAARVRALSRRKLEYHSPQLVHGPLLLEKATHRAWLDGKPLELPLREWALLEFLVRRVEQVASKEQILDAISDINEVLTPNAVEVYVSRLRSKLEPAGIRIRTIRGFGYLLEAYKGDPVAM